MEGVVEGAGGGRAVREGVGGGWEGCARLWRVTWREGCAWLWRVTWSPVLLTLENRRRILMSEITLSARDSAAGSLPGWYSRVE